MCRFLETNLNIRCLGQGGKGKGNIGDIWNRYNRRARAPSDIVGGLNLVVDRYVEGTHYQVLVKNDQF